MFNNETLKKWRSWILLTVVFVSIFLLLPTLHHRGPITKEDLEEIMECNGVLGEGGFWQRNFTDLRNTIHKVEVLLDSTLDIMVRIESPYGISAKAQKSQDYNFYTMGTSITVMVMNPSITHTGKGPSTQVSGYIKIYRVFELEYDEWLPWWYS